MFLIVPGLKSILRYGFNWGSGSIVIIGLIFILDSQDIISSRLMWKLVFPLMLVAIGISIIVSFFRKYKITIKVEYNSEYKETKYSSGAKHYKCDNSQNPRYSTVLGGGEVRNNSENLKSVTVQAVLGGFDVDLRDAKITEDIDLDITAVLEGVDIY